MSGKYVSNSDPDNLGKPVVVKDPMGVTTGLTRQNGHLKTDPANEMTGDPVARLLSAILLEQRTTNELLLQLVTKL